MQKQQSTINWLAGVACCACSLLGIVLLFVAALTAGHNELGLAALSWKLSLIVWALAGVTALVQHITEN